MNAEIESRVDEFERQIVFFPPYRRAFELLNLAIESTKLRGIPTSTVISAPSGAGKTTLLNYFHDQFEAESEELTAEGVRRIIPVIYLSVPPKVTIKDLAKAILEKLHVFGVKGDTVDLTRMVIKNLKTCQTRAILLDEIQLFAKHNPAKSVEDAADWLRNLLDQINIAVIVAGTPECKEFIYGSSLLARRYPYLATLGYFNFDDSPECDYTITLKELDKKMYSIGNLHKGAHLTDSGIRIPLYVATSGNLEYIRQILHLVFLHCLRNEASGPCINDFAMSCSLLELKLNLAKTRNPFEMNLADNLNLIERHQNESPKLRRHLAA
ncbi:TniB family NTP-binding protein [Pseudomonas sp. TCU-HL1]|uniref:TniB family NTP-binding protein n=1 Tax=Pseudomonas sp. TCU-HL1 TaxID=1856685 RepID=UPI00083DB83D|nr:TniB family NTP-binding protein [Pseudomonas sp. TCU-HL1]AOE86749.1 hypothetical protein THL1_4201 [Pseudomonas sp. TCU-HL1]